MRKSGILSVIILLILSILTACGGPQSSIRSSAQPTVHTSASTFSVILPDYYASGMVFQRDKALTIRGTAQSHNSAESLAGNELTAIINRENKIISKGHTTITEDGTFTITLTKIAGSLEPCTLIFLFGGQEIYRLEPVYIGDVFVAAGQSNMELNYAQYYSTPQRQQSNLGAVFALTDLPHLIDDSSVHFLTTAHSTDTRHYPIIEQNQNGWLTATGDNSKYVGYLPQLFAQQIREHDQNIPVGIIQTAWGGTPISRHVKGGDIYESHIAPLRDFAVAGVLWYQGCSDSDDLNKALQYESQFTSLINQYRTVFNDDELPFLYVQLARYANGRYTPYIREAQLNTLYNSNLDSANNVAMTVSIDTDKGTSAVIHPLGKDILAQRMASQWEAMHNHQAVPMGPLVQSAHRDQSGNVIVTFKETTAQGLQIRQPVYTLDAQPNHVSNPTGQQLQGIAVAGSDGNFVDGEATISGNTLIISSSKVDSIRQVSYLWSADPKSDALLYNASLLPASPFVIAVG